MPRRLRFDGEKPGFLLARKVGNREFTIWLFNIAMENHHVYGNINYFYGPSSIAMLSYKRVTNDIMLFGFAQVYYGISWYIMVYPNTMVIPTMQKINVSISLVNPGSSGESTK